ncbi:MAG: hypothetical protein ACFCU6_14435 [Balneolaceae bacterium]
MKYATRLAMIPISLFFVSCIANINANDEINDDLNIDIKIHGAVYEELSDLFGQEPIIVGVITAFEDGDDFFRILIEEDQEVNSPTEPGGKKMWLTINNETEVLIKDENNNVSDIDDRNLELGLLAGGWVADGDVIAESYPSQATANRIVIVNPSQ